MIQAVKYKPLTLLALAMSRWLYPKKRGITIAINYCILNFCYTIDSFTDDIWLKGFQEYFNVLFAKVLSPKRNQSIFYVAKKYPVIRLSNTEYLYS